MSDYSHEEDYLSPDEIEKRMENAFTWRLDDGILICLGQRPERYDWSESGDNDAPIRLKAACLAAIKKGQLTEIEIKNEKRILRDELVKFCYAETGACEDTYKIWQAYQIKRGHALPVDDKSELYLKIQKAVGDAMLEAYSKRPDFYAANPSRLKMRPIHIRVAKNNDWPLNTVKSYSAGIDGWWTRDEFKKREK